MPVRFRFGANTTSSFDVPYRCLVPRRIDGLLMGAGRSINTDDPTLLRVMAHTMVVGQGAGVAAAVAARTGASPLGSHRGGAGGAAAAGGRAIGGYEGRAAD